MTDPFQGERSLLDSPDFKRLLEVGRHRGALPLLGHQTVPGTTHQASPAAEPPGERGTAPNPGKLDTPWEVQRYDSAWAGFRAVPTAFDDDSPARYAERQAAIDAVLAAAERMSVLHRFRVYNVDSGAIVEFVRRGHGRLVPR